MAMERHSFLTEPLNPAPECNAILAMQDIRSSQQHCDSLLAQACTCVYVIIRYRTCGYIYTHRLRWLCVATGHTIYYPGIVYMEGCPGIVYVGGGGGALDPHAVVNSIVFIICGGVCGWCGTWRAWHCICVWTCDAVVLGIVYIIYLCGHVYVCGRVTPSW